MPGIQRVGDANSQGGVISGGGISSVRMEGRPVSVPGDPVSAHFCCGRKGCPPVHCSARTSGGSATVKAGGQSIILTGNSDTCGHPRVGGTSTVNIG